MKIKKTGQPGKSKSHEEWIYGLNPVLEALRSGRGVKSVVISSSRKDRSGDVIKEIALRGLKLKEAGRVFFDDRFPKGHQGIAALVSLRKYVDVTELLTIPSKKGETPFFVILDGIEDPRNFGAIVRVADAGGVHGIVIQTHRAASLGPEAIKASAGAYEYVPVTRVSNIKHAIKYMKKEGVTVIGAESGADMTLWDVDLRGPLAVVVGSEGKGMRRTVTNTCDILASLPMRGQISSLNASVATGVIVYEVLRQRQTETT